MASTDKMKCALCNERNGKTRCEGCNTLFCLPCMNKHQDELGQKFELLMDVRNEVKQSLDICRSTSSNGKQMPCLLEIDEWEQKMIQRIQQVAANARTNVNELMIKYMNEISDRFGQISIHMQQQQKEGDYLESDIERIKTQLDDLKNDIKHVSGKIQVDSSISNNIEWDTLIYVLEEELPSKATSESVQTGGKVTKKNKKLGLISQFSKAEKSNDSSRTIFPTDQSAARASKPNSIPVHFVQSNTPSNNYNQRADQSSRCVLCDQVFDDPTDARICPKCDYKILNPIWHNDVISRPVSQLPSTNSHPSVNDRSHSPALSSIPNTRAPRQIRCPYCGNLNISYNPTNNSDFHCSACQNLISFADSYSKSS